MPLLMPSQWSNALELKVPWKKSFVRAEHIWVMHQHKFPINNPSIMIFENGVEVEKTLDLSTPPPAYQLWNVYAELELVKNLSFSIKVTNLANTSYKNYLNRLRYFSNEMGRNCTLSLRLKF
jgi:iron complex outermembrane receptor protein